MKAKILKKGRKRYKWFYSGQGNIFCVNTEKQVSFIIDKEFLMNYWQESAEWVDNCPCGFDLLAFRTLKVIMFGEYGWSFLKTQYSIANRGAKRLEQSGIKRKVKSSEQNQNVQ